jgi:RsmE family RNA methyltransferase
VNLLLLLPPEVDARGNARVEGRRLEHVRSVHDATVGESLKVGVVGGKTGQAEITRLDDQCLELCCRLADDPPPPLPLTLVLALPRPPVLRRVLQHVAAAGIKKLVLLHAKRVEKSYWQSSALEPDAISENLLLGLEQARDTILPEVLMHRRFRPFVEDDLPSMARGTTALLAHPEAAKPCPANLSGSITLVIGPEGGFIPFEIDLLCAQGLAPITLGPRPLRVEAAVSALIGRLMPDPG